MDNKFFEKLLHYKYNIIIFFVAISSIFFAYNQIKEPPAPLKFKDKIITIEDVENIPEPSLSMSLSHVYNMTKAPHPSGSDAIKDVRKYLINQIESMGLEYEIQSFERDILQEHLQKHYEQIANDPKLAEYRKNFAKKEGFDSFEDYYKYFFQGNTEYQNILVKIGPKTPKYKFLMMAHYDSVKFGPGAGDDAVSVASLLECMRILSLKNDMQNAIYFLITDGEELGLVGANYFVKNPLFDPKEITLVTNFEARGNKGIPLMFRSSENNKNLLKIISESIDKKWTFSWFNDIFKIMPNSTDLGIFINNGYKGLDFGMAQGSENYHKASDNYENLSIKSANQYLKTVTDLAKYFSSIDEIKTDSNEDGLVFSFFNGKIIVLSNSFMKIFGIIISVLSIIFLIFAFIKKKYKIKDSLICMSSILISSSFAVLMYFLQNQLIRIFPWLTFEIYGLIFIFLISLAVVILFILLVKKFFKIENISLKAVTILIFSILSALSSVMFNGASYIFSVPLLFILISALLEIFLKNNILNLFFKSIEIFIFCMLFIPSIIILQIAIPYYIFAFYILSIVGIMPLFSELISLGIKN